MTSIDIAKPEFFEEYLVNLSNRFNVPGTKRIIVNQLPKR